MEGVQQVDDMTFLWKTRGCNTGPCPALIKADGAYYVQHKQVTDPAVRARLMEVSAANGNPLAADEDYGWVQADVIDRIAGMPITADEFGERLRSIKHSAFRFEMPSWQAPAEERAEFTRFQAGRRIPPTEVDWWRPWLDQVSRLTAEGKTISRVRILAEPPSGYQQWQLWAAPWHARAGEDIRYLRARDGGRLPARDWELLDDKQLIFMEYTLDGEVAALRLTEDSGTIARYREFRDLALQYAAPAATIAAA